MSTTNKVPLDVATALDYLKGLRSDPGDAFYEQLNTKQDSLLIKMCFVLLARVGFILIQVGCVPIENIYIIVLKNLLEIGVSVCSYMGLGCMISFSSRSFAGFLGYGDFYVALEDISIGLCAVLIGSGIISTALSARVHVVSMILVSIFYSALCQPLIMHWIWSDRGIFFQSRLGGAMYCTKDHGGLIIIHLSSSIVVIIGLFFLGRRLIPLRNVGPLSIGFESSLTVLLGYFFVITGLIAFEAPSRKYGTRNGMIPLKAAAMVLYNLESIAISSLVSVILHAIVYKNHVYTYWIFVTTLQSALSSVVVISGAVDTFDPLVIIILALLNSIIFFFVAIGIQYTAYEDNTNVVAVHFAPSLLGNLAVALFASDFSNGHYGKHVFMQIGAYLIVFIFFTIFFTIFFCILYFTHILQAPSEKINNQLAKQVNEYRHKKLLWRLLDVRKPKYRLEPKTILFRLKSYTGDLTAINPIPEDMEDSEKKQ